MIFIYSFFESILRVDQRITNLIFMMVMSAGLSPAELEHHTVARISFSPLMVSRMISVSIVIHEAVPKRHPEDPYI